MSSEAIDKVAEAIEQELDRDIHAWIARWTFAGGIYNDAPEPPMNEYKTNPKRLAIAAIKAYKDAA